MAAQKKATPRTRSKGTKTAAKRTKRTGKRAGTSTQRNRPQKKLKPAKKGTLVNESPLSLPRSVSLAQLNPFRLPVHPDQLAIATARFGGAFFVVVGGLFSLYHLHAFGISFLPDTPRPELAASVSQSTTTSTTSTAAIVDATPDVSFSIDAAEPLTGAVPITLTVEDADEMGVFALDAQTLSPHIIGEANRVADNAWNVTWHTTQVPDGTYKLAASVINQHGEYDDYSGTTYTVGNDDESADTSTTTTTEQSGDVAQIEAEPPVRIDLLPHEPLSDLAKVQVEVDNAERVKITLVELQSDTTTNLGDAVRIDDATWELEFDTHEYPNGDYAVIAVIKNQYGTYDSDQLLTAIENVVDDSDSSTADSSESTTSVLNDSETDSTATQESAEESTSDENVVMVESDTNEAELDTLLKPNVQLNVANDRPFTQTASINIDVEGAHFIEMYAVGRYSGIQHFLGLAQRIDSTQWLFRWDTTQSPNGAYYIFSRIKNDYGIHESKRILVEIYNEPEPVSDTQDTQPPTSESAETTSDDSTETTATPTGQPTESVVQDKATLGELFDADGNGQLSTADRAAQYVAELRADQSDVIGDLFARYGTALRAGDDAAISRFADRIRQVESEMNEAARAQIDDSELLNAVVERISRFFAEQKLNTERAEELLRERDAAAAQQDTDQDGISDHDEIKLYGTNPQSADTDNDGFTDGAEILGGFDPNDPSAEALVRYESPKESGVEREDILSVSQIETATKTQKDVESTGTDAEAIIRGTALPNSFVTLYIFSTPVVVTVKTDADGNWTYRFDKELEDGTHEVYVGITDNAGRLVAKSRPFAFVKEAQAFTPVDAAGGATVQRVPESSGFGSQGMVLLILSLSVVAVGLVLIIIGLNLLRTREKETLESQTQRLGSV